MKLVREEFVALAASDVEYAEHPDQSKAEARQMRGYFGGKGLQQGIYAVSSGGAYLVRANAGWPDPDPNGTLQALQKSLRDYRALPSSRRVRSAPFALADRMVFMREQFTKPKGTLDLRVVTRGYAYPGMTTFDERHPKYYGMDRLWYKPSEWRGWIPGERRVGASREVDGPLRDRIVLRSHQHQAQAAWDISHIRQAKMTSTITGVEGDHVSLRIEANYSMKADTRWNKSTYAGDLLAYATVDTSSGAWTDFRGAMLGTWTVGMMPENLRVGDPSQRTASSFRLNPLDDPDDAMRPSQWRWGYGLAWCRTP